MAWHRRFDGVPGFGTASASNCPFSDSSAVVLSSSTHEKIREEKFVRRPETQQQPVSSSVRNEPTSVRTIERGGDDVVEITPT